MFGEDLRGELGNKLGVESSGSPVELLDKAESELKAGNGIEAKKLFKEIITIAGNNAIRYEGQTQHRAAAQEYYIQALAYEYMEQTSERDTNYGKVINGLLSYAKSAMQFNENEKAITSATLAGMVSIVSGDNKGAFEIFNQHSKSIEGKMNEESLKLLLNSLGYLLDALQNTNMNALQTATNLISKDLTPMLTTAKLTGFNKLMNSVMNYTQDMIQSKVKMPNMNVETTIPRDLLFNEVFEIELSINNSADGEAYDLTLNIDLPDDLEILSGNKQVSYDKMSSNSKEKVVFSLRFQTALEAQEIVKEIKGGITYKDMLGNSHTQYFGPLFMEIRSVSKSAEYLTRLEMLNKEYQTISTENSILKMLLPPLRSMFESAVTQVESQIEAKEYGNVDYALFYLSNVLDWQKNILGENEVSEKVIQFVEDRVETEKNTLSEELKREYQRDKQLALSELEKRKDEDKANALSQQREELVLDHNSKINELKEEHFKEVGKINQMHDNKFNKYMAEQEQQLEAKFVQDMNARSDKFEITLRDLQNQHGEELERERTKLKEDLLVKHNQEMDTLRQTKEEEIRKLKEAHEEALENALLTQKSRLRTQSHDELEQTTIELTRELTTKFERNTEEIEKRLNKEIDIKDKEIQELERQIRDFKASSE